MCCACSALPSIFITTRQVNASWRGCHFLRTSSLRCGRGSTAVVCDCKPVTAGTATMKRAREEEGEEEQEQEQAAPAPMVATPAHNPWVASTHIYCLSSPVFFAIWYSDLIIFHPMCLFGRMGNKETSNSCDMERRSGLRAGCKAYIWSSEVPWVSRHRPPSWQVHP